MSRPDLFSNLLNPPQLEAVHALDGPLLILAGAGSGKTRVLTYRIANLILQGKASPDEILAVTFTNKAARNMESRTVEILLQNGIPIYSKLWISTFHSSCARILREHTEEIGLKRPFVIFDDSEQLAVVKKVCEILNINDKVYPPKNFLSKISEAKQVAVQPSEFVAKKHHFLDQKAADVYAAYEKELQKNNALDFDDLLLKTYLLFKNEPGILASWQDRFKYILVDEYQDTNRIQYLLLKLLSSKHRNLCVVGDEDQSIYSWRGADIRNILGFEEDFPEAKVIKLEQNYRSTKTIVLAASELISHNTQRKEKTLFTDNLDGDPIIVREENSEYDEARFVVKQVESIARDEQAPFRHFAVFYRTNAQSRVLEDQLRSHGIPYKIVGSVKFYERQEIKDSLAYLRLIMNPRDDLSFKRIVNKPGRKIGATSLEKVEQIGIDHNLSLLEASFYALQNRILHAGAARGLEAFLALITRLQTEIAQAKPSEALQLVLDETGYVKMLKDENTPESLGRIENLQELYNAVCEFERERADDASLATFLEEIALVTDMDNYQEDEDAVTMMTLHLSKGLEYPYAFIVGWEEGLLPSRQATSSMDETAIEEERRLAYVGMTRAEKRLHLTYARKRTQWGQEQMNPPSRFLKEIPEKYLKRGTNVATPGFLKYYQDKYGSLAEQAPSAQDDFSESSYGSSSYGKRTGVIRRPSAQQNEYSQESSYDDTEITKGARVRHPTFGTGIVHKTEGSGDSMKITILFGNNTLKTFAAKFARLERI